MKQVEHDNDEQEIKVTIWNFLSVEWITRLLFRGAIERITKLPRVPRQIQAENVVLPRTNQVFLYILKKYWFQIFMAILLQGATVSCVLATPTYLEQIILYLDPRVPRFVLKNSSGVVLSLILFALQMGRTVFIQTSNQFSFYILIDIKTSLIGAVYEKSLRLSQSASQKYTQGQILNLVNVDIEKVSMAFLQFATLLMAPVQVTWSVVLLGDYLGYSVWAGAGALFGILIMQTAVIGFLAKFQKEFLQYGDKRLKMIREVLYGIKIIKFRTLENFFYERITKLRMEQMSVLKKYYFIQVYFVGLIQMAPIVMPIGAFLTYGAVNGSISAEKIFPSLSLFNGLFQPILTVPQAVTALVVGTVSWKRVVEFLLAEESEDVEIKKIETDLAIDLDNVTFEWQAVKKEEAKEPGKGKEWGKMKKVEEAKPDKEGDVFQLKDVNIKIKKGVKVAIVGAVGSGKSSLLSGLIGDMPKKSGEFETFGTVAYCSQQPWILTDTIEGNIVFHQQYDEVKLNSILKVCGLDSDLKLFPAKIRTEIGEKGVNLSGGQKARVALARAMYRNPDILLLDDPISALDAQVGRLVFENGIMGYLKDKTVILVTHQLFLLPDVDHIVVLDKGKVVEQGSFTELSEKKGFLTEMMKSYRLDDQNATKAKEKEATKSEDDSDAKGGIIVAEDKENGNVQWSVFWHYFDKCGGWTYVIIFVGAALLNSATQIMNNLWLSWWTTQKYGYSLKTYMEVYGYLGLGQFAFALVINSVFLFGAYRASKYYHGAALRRLLRAPMGFFDSQPIGRILNRMSKDVESIDQNIWIILFLATIAFAGALSSLIFLSYVEYRMLYLVVPLSVLYFYIIKYYQRSNIEFKRYESNNRSPLYAHISETLVGVSTVKAFGVTKEFVQKQRRLMDISNAPTFLRMFAQVWVSLRLEMLGSTLTLVLALLGVTAADSSNENSSLIGLSLTYAIGFAGLLNLLLFSSAQLETEFNSVERLKVYCEDLEQEPDETKDDDPKDRWPLHGHIVFENACLSYPSRPDVLILKKLSFEVNPGEKVGIIGRTGSGKSTLMTALYRLVELREGKIEIDGLDISKMGLKTLRQNIEIIPQEPVLFSGTIRENLDVTSAYEDVDVWDVLERIGLKEYVSSLNEKLQSEVLENGENLSVGQRQLICLGRAILSKPKILIMDEATASVDTEADALIQESIKTQFKETTVLSIAHRLNTIADFDRVLVLQDGVRMEYDTPYTLLKNPTGLFSQLADATGSANSSLLREIALKKHQSSQ